jgi:hypothetical protein
MCLAIGTATQTRRTALGRAWWRIARTPERLLPLGAAVHAALFAALVAVSQASGAENFTYATVVTLLAIANLAASGFAMARFSLWADRSPVHYVLYGSSFALGFFGLLLLEAALATGTRLEFTAATMVAAGALLSLRGIGAVYGWVKPYRRVHATAVMGGLSASTLLLAGLAVYAL